MTKARSRYKRFDVLVESLNFPETATITLAMMPETNSTMDVEVTAATGMPVITPVSVVATDMAAISLGNWPDIMTTLLLTFAT